MTDARDEILAGVRRALAAADVSSVHVPRLGPLRPGSGQPRQQATAAGEGAAA